MIISLTVIRRHQRQGRRQISDERAEREHVYICAGRAYLGWIPLKRHVGRIGRYVKLTRNLAGKLFPMRCDPISPLRGLQLLRVSSV